MEDLPSHFGLTILPSTRELDIEKHRRSPLFDEPLSHRIYSRDDDMRAVFTIDEALRICEAVRWIAHRASCGEELAVDDRGPGGSPSFARASKLPLTSEPFACLRMSLLFPSNVSWLVERSRLYLGHDLHVCATTTLTSTVDSPTLHNSNDPGGGISRGPPRLLVVHLKTLATTRSTHLGRRSQSAV